MFNHIHKMVLVAIIAILFTPAVEGVFAILGAILGVAVGILGAINPVGLITIVLVVGGLWAYRHLDILVGVFEDSDEEEDWLN